MDLFSIMVNRARLTQGLMALLGVVMVALTWAMPAYATSFDRQNLRMSDFSNQDLRGNDYTRADLADANLSHVNLRGVRLFDTTLARANLEGADLTGATLDGARLVRANLTNAILEGAYAFGTDFREAIIDGADFTDVLLDPKVNQKMCEVATGTNPVTGRNTRDTLYCP
ncbi:MAG: pentapeptide repeat-containing protein [Nodosilinea sp.]